MMTFDRTILLTLNQFAGKSEIFDKLMLDIADSAMLKGAVFMAYFWYVWFGGDSDTIARRKTVVISLVGVFVAALAARTLQLVLPLHGRPLHTSGIGFTLPSSVNPETLNLWNSFPSDHAVL